VIERATFDRMKERWGKYGSWAFWADATDSSVRSNVGDLTVLDPDAYPDLFGILHDDVVMIGLNISRPFDEALRNFHDSYTRAKDHKIRFAFKDTSFYGAWMTDIVKGVPMTDSKSLMRYLRENPAVVHRSVRDFLHELTDLGGPAPTGLAFGGDATISSGTMFRETYGRLIRLMHYSNYNSQGRLPTSSPRSPRNVGLTYPPSRWAALWSTALLHERHTSRLRRVPGRRSASSSRDRRPEL
jgi:hypothetical protein